MRILIAALIILSVVPSYATTLFTESFDSAINNNNGWYDGSATSIDTSVFHEGTGSLRLAWTSSATRPTGIDAIRKEITASDHLYISQYWRFNTNWVGSGSSAHPHLVMILSDTDHDTDPYSSIAYDYLNTYIETNNVTPRLEIQDGMNISTAHAFEWTAAQAASTQTRAVAGCNGAITGSDAGDAYDCYDAGGGTYYNGRRWGGSSNFSLNTWHKVETYFVMNTISGGVALADGVMKMWVDGNLVINNTHMVYRTNAHPTMKWHEFVIAPWIGDGSPQAQTMWIDDLVVADSMPETSVGSLRPGVSASGVTFR